jgi:hypothetical protein
MGIIRASSGTQKGIEGMAIFVASRGATAASRRGPPPAGRAQDSPMSSRPSTWCFATPRTERGGLWGTGGRGRRSYWIGTAPTRRRRVREGAALGPKTTAWLGATGIPSEATCADGSGERRRGAQCRRTLPRWPDALWHWVLVLTGPNMMYLVTHTLQEGRGRGPSLLSVAAGFLVYLARRR